MNQKYKDIKKLYNNNVKDYAKNGGILLLENLNYFISFMPLRGKILDIGSGVGQDVEFFNQKGYVATGIDFSHKMIEYSRKERKGGKFITLDLFKIKNKFSEKSFDGIWISSVLTHLEKKDITKALKIVKWALSPNGVVGIIVKKKTSRKNKDSKVIYNEFYKKDIITHLKSSNFKIVNIREFNAHNNKWFFILAKKI